MSAPLVSIIIPCHNAAKWVEAAARSAMEQTWPNKEVLLVNDGSTDGSLEIVRRLEKDGLRVIDQAQAGASAARNAGIAASRGDYLQFLDADDLLAPEKIERQLEALPENVVASCAWGTFFDDSDSAVFTREPAWKDAEPVDWLVTSWSGGGMMHPAAWLTPRAVADAAGPWNESLSLDDDGEYFCRVLLRSRRVKFVPGAKTYYRTHDGPRLSASKGRAAAASSFASCELKERHLLAIEDSPRTRRAVGSNYSRFAWEQLASAPDLAGRAVKRWQEIAPEVSPPRGGVVFQVVAALLGWEAARRLQLALSRN